MPDPVNINTAETNLRQMVRRAASKDAQRFLITEPDGQKAILLGFDDYLRLITRPLPITEELNHISRINGNDKMTMEEIDAEIAEARADKRKAV